MAADIIVFSSQKLEGKTKDWKSVKVQYVELYSQNNLIDARREVMGRRYVNSLVSKEKQEDIIASIEMHTVKVYIFMYMRKMKRAVRMGSINLSTIMEAFGFLEH